MVKGGSISQKREATRKRRIMKSLYMQRQIDQGHSEEGGNKVDNEVATLKMSEELFAYLDKNQIGKITP